MSGSKIKLAKPIKNSNPRKNLGGFRGVTLQLFFIAVMPLAILVLVITFGSLDLHQQAMRSLVADRDLHAIQFAAASISRDIDHRIYVIGLISRIIDTDGVSQLAVGQLSSDLEIFEGGVVVVEENGEVNFLFERNEIRSFTSSPEFSEALIAMKTVRSGQATLFPTQILRERYFTPIFIKTDSNRIVAGIFSPEQILSVGLSSLMEEKQGDLQVFDILGLTLFQVSEGNEVEINMDFEDFLFIQEQKNGMDIVKTPKGEIVITSARVEPTGWILVDKEAWENIASPLLRTTQNAPLIILPILILSIIALWFGIHQIVQPLQQLGSKAEDLAKGNFKTIKKSVGGIPEIKVLQNSMIIMADKLKFAQKNLQRYIGSITNSIENERRNLARELHDDTLQTLIALGQNTQFARHWNEDPKVGKSLDQIISLTDAGIKNLRRHVQGLRPIYIEDLGLTTALSMLALNDLNPNGIKVHFQQNGIEQRLDPDVEMSLYRIAQEALNNTFRHAKAKNTWIKIDFHENDVEMEIRDDGIGFNIPVESYYFASRGHFGLLGIKERADLIGAKLRIESIKGKGTRISVQYSRKSGKNEK